MSRVVHKRHPRERAGRPVFVVRVRATDHTTWPKVFKDERGHPLVGYDFVRANEDDSLGLPKGYPCPENAPDSKDYYQGLYRLAADMVSEMKALASANRHDEVHQPTRPPDLEEELQRVYLAAAPVEDVDDQREELAELLRRRGCIVVPEANPRDSDNVREHAGKWIVNCDKFVQVLGGVSGHWRYDDLGFVMYQHEVAKQSGKPIFVYRAPSVETLRVKKREYREFIEAIQSGRRR